MVYARVAQLEEQPSPKGQVRCSSHPTSATENNVFQNNIFRTIFYKRYMKFYDDVDTDVQTEKKQKKQKEIVLTEEEKKSRANSLICKDVDNKNILGYLSDNSLSVKYDKSSGDYVVYNNNSEIIFFDILTIRQYEENKWSKYMYADELSF